MENDFALLRVREFEWCPGSKSMLRLVFYQGIWFDLEHLWTVAGCVSCFRDWFRITAETAVLAQPCAAQRFHIAIMALFSASKQREVSFKITFLHERCPDWDFGGGYLENLEISTVGTEKLCLVCEKLTATRFWASNFLLPPDRQYPRVLPLGWGCHDSAYFRRVNLW